MPYKSEEQRRFFNSPAGKKKLGKEEVEKWNEESEGQKNLPKKVKSIDKAIRNCDFRAAKSVIGDEVIASCSGMISLLQAIRSKAAGERDEDKLREINKALIKANDIIRKL